MLSATIPVENPASDSRSEKLPEYAAEIAAFHEAFAPELQCAIATFPWERQGRVLDVCCGDGFYLQLLGELLGPGATLVGLDANRSYLDLARRRLQSQRLACDAELICGTIDQMDRDHANFDFVWCAQSLFSLPDPVVALRQMATLTRIGGMVAVLENDTLHQLQLPWPGNLEITIRKAELAALEAQSTRPEKYYVGRRLPEIFDAAGLEPGGCWTQAIDRPAPFDAPLVKFLSAYLSRLFKRVAPHLEPSLSREFASLIDPGDPNFMLGRPHVNMTWLNTIAWAPPRLTPSAVECLGRGMWLDICCVIIGTGSGHRKRRASSPFHAYFLRHPTP